MRRIDLDRLTKAIERDPRGVSDKIADALGVDREAHWRGFLEALEPGDGLTFDDIVPVVRASDIV